VQHFDEKFRAYASLGIGLTALLMACLKSFVVFAMYIETTYFLNF